MKLRRALATAAVTAVIAPATLLAAPAAYATQEAPEAPAGSVTAGSSGDTAPGTSENTSPGGPKNPSAPAAGKATVQPVVGDDDKNPCKKTADPKEKSRATTELIGYPDKVVAGSGKWKPFSLRATNSSKERLESTCLHVDTVISRVSAPSGTDSTEFVTMEWFDPAGEGSWQPIANSRDDSTHFALVSNLAAGEQFDIRLRLKVDAKTKAGRANTHHAGIFVGKGGVCGKTAAPETDKNKAPETFEILPAGTKLDEVEHSKSPSPTPSRSSGPSKASPSASASASSSASPSASASASASPSSSTGTGGTGSSGSTGTSAQGSLSNTSVNGELAKTGSSSSTPVIAGLAAAAVVAGGAAVAVARRRKNDA